MNAELLLEHFHRLGDAPDALPRLRRFILDLAVRGKLVEQNAEDTPAAVQLKRIASARQRMVHAAEIKTPRVTEAQDGAEPTYELPDGWSFVPLNELSPMPLTDGDWIETKDQAENGRIRLVQLADVGDGDFRNRSNRFITEETEARLNCTRLVPGDVLIARLPSPIGRACVFPDLGRPAITSVDVAILRSDENVSRDYLVIAVNSPSTREQIEAYGKGTTRFRVSTGHLRTVHIPLPPLAEQHRIVAKVEELMALCDRLEAAKEQREAERTRLTAAAWQAVVQAEAPADVSFALEQLPVLTTRPAQVKALRQTILDLAVRGRLVEQDAKDEPAEVTEAGNVESDDLDLYPLPTGWAWTRLQATCELITDGEHATPKRIDEHEVPLVTAKNVRDGFMDYSITDWVSRETAEKAWKRCKPVPNDILLVCVGATIGRLTVLNEAKEMVLVRSVALIRPSRSLASDYAAIALRSPFCQSQMWSKVRVAAQPCLYLNRINSLQIPIPPLAEQRRIVAKVEELMALCDGLEAALTAGEALRGQVLEAVVRSETGGTEPPAPVRVRQLPVPKVRAPRYEEAEVELAVAAEPVGHTGALQAVVRRGPGRPPKNGALTSTAARIIEDFLKTHPGWHGKAAILEATGVDASAWNAAIKALLEAGKVERQGEKKGARYRGRTQ